MQDITRVLTENIEAGIDYIEYFSYLHEENRENDFTYAVLMDEDLRTLTIIGYYSHIYEPSCVIKITEEELKNPIMANAFEELAKTTMEKQLIYHYSMTSAYTEALVYHHLITISVNHYSNNEISAKWILNTLDKARQNAQLYSDLIDWNWFAKEMAKIEYVNTDNFLENDIDVLLHKFDHFKDINLTFMLLSNNEYAKEQYYRYIKLLRRAHEIMMCLK